MLPISVSSSDSTVLDLTLDMVRRVSPDDVEPTARTFCGRSNMARTPRSVETRERTCEARRKNDKVFVAGNCRKNREIKSQINFGCSLETEDCR